MPDMIRTVLVEQKKQYDAAIAEQRLHIDALQKIINTKNAQLQDLSVVLGMIVYQIERRMNEEATCGRVSYELSDLYDSIDKWKKERNIV